MRIKKPGLIFISGLLWFVIGFVLLSKGINLIVQSMSDIDQAYFSLIQIFSPHIGAIKSALLLVTVGLFIGYIKGRYILIKTVKRVVSRILDLTDPIRISKVYSMGYFLLLLTMVGIGISFRFMPLSPDIRGIIDLAIGAALMNGSLLYFRFALAAKNQSL